MATYNLNVTASVDLLGSDISGSQSTDFAIANPLSGSSYFTFETVRNSDGFYDSSSPKNMAGTYTLGAGLAGLVKSDYIASVVVEPGGGTLTFVPTNYISGSSLNLRGTSAPPLPVSGGFDIDAQAFFDRVTTAGGSLSATEQTAVNTLVVQMKADGIWSKMKAVYPMVGASAAACAQNLKSSSFTGTFTSGWTFASTGVTPNGTSAYMNTNLNDLNDLGTNATISVYLNNLNATGWDLGVYTGSEISGISIRGSSGNYVNVRSGLGVVNYTESFTNALFTGTTNGTNNVIYQNATQKAIAAQLNNGINLSHYLGALNFNNTASLFGGSRIAIASFANSTFTQTDMTNFSAAVQTFQTTLSRQ